MVLFEGHGSPCGGFCVAIPGAGVAMTLSLDSFFACNRSVLSEFFILAGAFWG